MVAAAMAALGGLAVIAAIALEPRVAPRSGDSGPACSPKPCTAPGGFELYVSDVTATGSRVTLNVSFKNSTPGGGFEAVSYRHTSPADFSLSVPGGDKRRPVFDADCPMWEQGRIERGAGAGPNRLCFNAPASGARGATLFWSPDEGLFSITGSVPLG